MAKFILGLTGGIASGKSAAADTFALLGAAVIDTDQISREVVEPGTPALDEIEKHFGPDVINSDHTLNRSALRELVFADVEERRWLESLLHPAIRETAIARAKKAPNEIAILVVPLLFESGQYQNVDATLVIDVPVEVQRARTLARDGVSAAQVQAILAAQMDRSSRLAQADYVIENSGSLEDLQQKISDLYTQLQTRI